MYSRNVFDEATTEIAELGRGEIMQRIKDFHGRFRLDFTDDYLDRATLDHLRHILLAALLTTQAPR